MLDDSAFGFVVLLQHFDLSLSLFDSLGDSVYFLEQFADIGERQTQTPGVTFEVSNQRLSRFDIEKKREELREKFGSLERF